MICSKNNDRVNAPYYGIFWVIAETESGLTEQNLFYVAVPYIDNENADDKQVFNHKRHWQTLDRKITHGKTFDYYPRGRVEIRNDKATVWLNGNIPHLADKIIDIYGLSALSQVCVKVDGSSHYNSHFDR